MIWVLGTIALVIVLVIAWIVASAIYLDLGIGD